MKSGISSQKDIENLLTFGVKTKSWSITLRNDLNGPPFSIQFQTICRTSSISLESYSQSKMSFSITFGPKMVFFKQIILTKITEKIPVGVEVPVRKIQFLVSKIRLVCVTFSISIIICSFTGYKTKYENQKFDHHVCHLSLL